MIQVGDKILVRSGTGVVKATVVRVNPTTLEWQTTTNSGRSQLNGLERLGDSGLTWTDGWSQDSYNVLRFIQATERW